MTFFNYFAKKVHFNFWAKSSGKLIITVTSPGRAFFSACFLSAIPGHPLARCVPFYFPESVQNWGVASRVWGRVLRARRDIYLGNSKEKQRLPGGWVRFLALFWVEVEIIQLEHVLCSPAAPREFFGAA